ncbi:hypothetical protein G6011_02549 [Alternaria panax]|uniref:BTB domain-containing protein n=1 Tax=Alternaria panax TaxID=48097 RepID=A0AAD4F9T5_9PLEO|nr:hypothetical protein G6011_02549 [Alternaria panax]
MTEQVLEDFKNRMRALLSSGDYSDLIITCGPDTYNVHKAIVCAQSSFFKKAEKFLMGKEAAEGRINLPEDDPRAVKLLVQFFYEGEYHPELPIHVLFDEDGRPTVTVPKQDGYNYDFPHTCTPGCPSPSHKVCHHHECTRESLSCGEKCINFICKKCTMPPPHDGDAAQLLLHAMMYELADKYHVTGLKPLAQKKFSRWCEAFWEAKEFAMAAEHALTTTPDSDTGLR